MNTNPLRTAIVLPEDNVFAETDLKRTLLTFDRIKIPPLEDNALFNSQEWKVEHSGRKTYYAERVPYIRAQGYGEEYRELVERIVPIMHDHLVEFASTAVKSEKDAKRRDYAYNLAVSNAKVVQAATPDRSVHQPGHRPVDGVYYGLYIGGTAEHNEDLPPPAKLTDSHEDWELVGLSRVGRMVKYLMLASEHKCVPVALGQPSAGVLMAISRDPSLPGSAPGDQYPVDTAIQWDLFDRARLDKELPAMTWKDIRDLRRVTLPAIDELRRVLRNRARLGPVSDLETQRSELSKLQKEFSVAKEKAHEAVMKAKIGLALSAILGATTFGGAAFVLPALSWAGVLGLLFGGIGAVGAKIPSEIKQFAIGRGKQRQHPLFQIDRVAPVNSP